jgi:hypothetical protein
MKTGWVQKIVNDAGVHTQGDLMSAGSSNDTSIHAEQDLMSAGSSKESLE